MRSLERVRAAYRALVRADRHLLEVNSSERSLTHKLAEHMRDEFPGWDIDCEYNRDGRAVKTHDGPVLPDVIVHHRGTDENLVVIEAKKRATYESGNDVEKLRRFKEDLRYQTAILVTFPTGFDAADADANHDVVEIDV